MSEFYNHHIPDAAHTFIGHSIGAGISVMAFAPGGGWVGVTANGVYEANGIPQECFDTLVSFQKNGWKVQSIAFPPQGGNRWVIVADRGYMARGIPDECYQMMGTFWQNKWTMRCIAFPSSGGNSWVIVGTDHLFARAIDDECYQFLNNYMQGERRASGVAFMPRSGWTVFGSDAFFARRIDNDCYQHMRTIASHGNAIDHVAFVPDGDGYSIIANQASPFISPDPIRTFENDFIRDAAGTSHSVWERMAGYGVPGANVALVYGGAVAWRTSYGVIETGTQNYVYCDTPFQAASISKPHTAVGLLRLAEDGTGKVKLDDPVQKHTTWAVPVRACGSPAWVGQATIALTLEHKGGFIGRDSTYPLDHCADFTKNKGGAFAGYPNNGTPLPTLDQTLAGTPPANSPKIELSMQPGPNAFSYSGMGYVALLRMVQDVTGTSFSDWMQSHVLAPLGMSGSTFGLTLPPQLSRAATGHWTGPVAIDGKRNRYPESSAAGLYTNAGDLCHLIVMLNAGGAIDDTRILTRQMRDRMITDQLGIFCASALSDPNCVYNHSGSNVGFSALIQGYLNKGAGFAVMTNLDDGAGGSAFIKEAANALKRIYSLP